MTAAARHFHIPALFLPLLAPRFSFAIGTEIAKTWIAKA
jgi:hypothetical protein